MGYFFKNPKDMTREEYIQHRVRWICCTSVADGQQSLRDETDVEIVQAALAYESGNYQRTTMLKSLESKLKQLEKTANG